MPFEPITTGIAPSSSPVTDANRAGDHVWLVVIAEDPKTGEITKGDITAQTRQALENLDQAVRAAGGTRHGRRQGTAGRRTAHRDHRNGRCGQKLKAQPRERVVAGGRSSASTPERQAQPTWTHTRVP